MVNVGELKKMLEKDQSYYFDQPSAQENGSTLGFHKVENMANKGPAKAMVLCQIGRIVADSKSRARDVQ